MSELELQNKTAQDVEDFIAIVKMHDNGISEYNMNRKLEGIWGSKYSFRRYERTRRNVLGCSSITWDNKIASRKFSLPNKVQEKLIEFVTNVKE